MDTLKGTNNGTFGYGMARGAVFPMNKYFGPGYFYKNYQLPSLLEQPTGSYYKVFQPKRGFGTSVVYQLTPGGVSTTGDSLGYFKFSKKKTRKSKKSIPKKKKNHSRKKIF